ncbi:MAG: TIGR01777 family oxidoreductase [Planctomycetota bacterium]
MSVKPNILITGSSGLLGRALAARLPGDGFAVHPLSRTRSDQSCWWDPPHGEVHLGSSLPLRSVLHLAGAGIADRPWTKERKRVLRESRVDATRTLCEALARLPEGQRPESLIMASGIGIYGDRGDEILREESAPGRGTLAELAVDWEAAADPAREAGIRVVVLRLGMILSREGGALGKMLTPFRLGLGGPIGSGRQFVSWIALPDAVSLFRAMIDRPDIRGPLNAVAPGCVSQRTFANALGKALGRPSFLPLPSLAVRAMFGEMGQELLLAGQRVEPARLLSLKHPFRYPHLEDALPAIGVG